MKSQPTILVLEDERPQLLVVRAALKGIGDLCEFVDPDAALDFLRRHSVDAAIVDIHMPACRINGMEFIKGVREFDQDLCVIIRTGDDSSALADEAIEVRAYRRAIKNKTSLDDLRELTLAAVQETRDRRQITLDAANTSGVKSEWVKTLGTVEEEVSVTDSYKGLLQSMRNRLTALAGHADILREADYLGRRDLLSEYIATNKALVGGLLAEVNAFMDGPFAQTPRSGQGPNRAAVNRILDSLRRHFLTTSRWAADQTTLRVSGLSQDMYVSAPPVRLLTALRHLVEFQLEHRQPDSVLSVTAHRVENVRATVGSIRGPRLFFDSSAASTPQPCIAFRACNRLSDTYLEDIRRALQEYPSDPRTGNLQMVHLSLGNELTAMVVHTAPVDLTVFELYVPVLH